MTNPRIYMGRSMYEYIHALLNNDTDAVESIRKSITEDNRMHREKEYALLEKILTPSEYDSFHDIDNRYQRHVGWTDSISFMGNMYRYTWQCKDILLDYDDYGKFELMIEFSQGRFSLYVYYCDETGYDQGRFYLDKDIDADDILTKIESLK